MRILLILLFAPLLSFAQPISLSDMIYIYGGKSDKATVIANFKKLGFDKESAEADRIHLKGVSGMVSVFFTDNKVDAVEYTTLDSTTFKSWETDLYSSGFSYFSTENNHKTYISLLLMALVYDNKDSYSIAILSRP